MLINKENTPQMFDEISQTYDKLNHNLSFSLDKIWRKKLVKLLDKKNYNKIIDIASGTGDLLVNLKKLNAKSFIALDPSKNMLEIAKKKFPEAEFILASAEDIPLADNSVELITLAFGIRNFVSVDKALNEFYRISKKNAQLAIMEFSLPKNFICKLGFKLYLNTIIPLWGSIISKDKTAYKYLSSSIINFAKNVNINASIAKAGFKNLKTKNLICGAVKIYLAIKN